MLTAGFDPRCTVMMGLVSVSTLFTADTATAQGMIGTWTMSVKVDQKALDKAMAAVKNEQQKAAFSQLIPSLKAMEGSLDVRQDGGYTMITKFSILGQEQTNKEEGTWKVIKEEGKSIVVETTETGKKKKQTHNITQIDKDNFVEAAPKEMGPLATAMKLQYSRKK